ncbi:MAG: putative sporulation protein YtxC [Desulfitobacteriaceae bacterium]|nr:putative sporulation protein YtxC [Desulfitobacteriaceae bacterium]MDI6915059.1 putative sporulation protein YtxC [Desulfitobacteriaceae bacterium]
MQHSVQLGTQYYHESICQHLRELKEQEELPFEVQETQYGKRWLIQCQFDLPDAEEPDTQRLVAKIHRYYLANALAKTILRHWEKDYVHSLLRKRYHLKRDEQEQVWPKAMKSLNEQDEHSNDVQRKATLINHILTYIEVNPVFDIEGFLRFRAREYRAEVDKAVAYAVDEYILEKEYFEFIDLLKHFLDTQEPRMEILHVGISARGKFHLYNEAGEKVTRDYLDGMEAEGDVSDFSYEDLLISALISAAPQEVILHIKYPGYRDTLETIRHVFEGKVKECPGCSLCEKLRNATH